MASGISLRGAARSLNSSTRHNICPYVHPTLETISSGTLTNALGRTGHASSFLAAMAMLSSRASADGQQATETAQPSATDGISGQAYSGQALSGAGVAAAALDAATLGPETSAAGVEGEGSGEHPVRQRFWWQAVKFVIGTTLTAATAGGAYVTYKYETSTLQKKLNEARASLVPASVRAGLEKEGVPPEQPLSTSAKAELDHETMVKGPFEGLYNTVANGLLDVAQGYLDLRHQVEEQIQGWSAPSSDKLLPDLLPAEQHLYTLVVDLNDTLVHSDWKRERGWRTFKRPGVDAFLEKMAQNYEVVVFSDQLNITVDPILDRLDQKGCIRYRLYRDGTQYLNGHYIKDFSKLNRDPRRVMYLSGHPESCMQTENLLPLPPWKVSEVNDTALLDLIPFLEYVGRHRPLDTRVVLASYEGQDIPTAFKERSKEVLRRQQERKQQGLFRLVR